MTRLFTIAIGLTLMCCNQRNSNTVHNDSNPDSLRKVLKNETGETKHPKVADALIGKWGIYSTSSDSIVTVCNQCPTIIFYETGVAVINFPGGSDETIKWKREDNVMQVMNITTRNKEAEFDDGSYALTFSGNKLVIKEVSTGYSYHLAQP